MAFDFPASLGLASVRLELVKTKVFITVAFEAYHSHECKAVDLIARCSEACRSHEYRPGFHHAENNIAKA